MSQRHSAAAFQISTAILKTNADTSCLSYDDPHLMLIYTASADSGIHLAHFETTTGRLSASRVVAGGQSFFLAYHPSKRVLYSVDENTAQVLAFCIEADGGLTPLNQVSSQGAVPCHLAVEPQGRFLVVSNYNGGVALFPLREDGGLDKAASLFQPQGAGPDKQRQSEPHPHGVTFTPDRDLLRVADLGTDRLWALDIADFKMHENKPLRAETAPSAGPRHLAFSPDGTLAIAVNELDNTLSLFVHDKETGALKLRKSYSMLPEGFEGVTHAAEIAFHPSGVRCYATNRGHNSVVIFSVRDQALHSPEWLQDGGKDPQHVICDPTGQWLAVAWRTTNEVRFYPLDKLGHPGKASAILRVSNPMCIAFVPEK